MPPQFDRELLRLQGVLAEAYELQERVQADIRGQSWSDNDMRMDEFNQLRARSIVLFPNDQILATLPEMPDRVLHRWGGNAPPEAASRRTESLVTQIIRHLEFLHPDLAAAARAPQTVAGQAFDSLTTDEREDYLFVTASARTAPRAPVDDRDFGWVSDTALRAVLREDFAEAQRALGAHAYKGAALLAAGVVEGMVLEVFSRSGTTGRDGYPEAVKGLPKANGVVDLNKASLLPLMEAVVRLGLARPIVLKWVGGTTDVRDTVHPRAEIRQGLRAKEEEATLLITLVRLLYRDFSNPHQG